MLVHFEKILRHNFRRRLSVVLASTSADTDVSLGGYSCLARLVGVLN